MKKAFLHVGFHKTATTSFQVFCNENRAALRDQGISYLPINKIKQLNSKEIQRNSPIANHSLLLDLIYKDINPGKVRALRRYKWIDENADKKHIDMLAQQYKHDFHRILRSTNSSLLVSAESISTMSRSQLKQLRKDFNDKDFSVHAFGLVRSPYEAINSGLGENIWSGRYKQLITISGQASNLLPINERFPLKSKPIENLIKVFPDIDLAPFNQAKKSINGPIGYLLSKIVDSKNFSSSLKSNPKNSSKSNVGVRVLNELNRNGILLPLSKDKIISNATAESFRLTENEFNAIKKIFDDEVKALNSLIGDRFTQEQISFSAALDPDQIVNFCIKNLLLTY